MKLILKNLEKNHGIDEVDISINSVVKDDFGLADSLEFAEFSDEVQSEFDFVIDEADYKRMLSMTMRQLIDFIDERIK